MIESGNIQKTSKKHSTKAKTRKCAACGKDFTPSKFVHNQQFCSGECRKAGYAEGNEPKGGTKTCKICGKTYTPKAGHEWESTRCPECKKASVKAAKKAGGK